MCRPPHRRYTFQHPERVDQLILASPCGVPDAPPPPDNLPLRWRVVRYLWGKGFTPHAITRWLGPLGPAFIRTVLRWRTSWMDERSAINDGTLNKDAVAEYLYVAWCVCACVWLCGCGGCPCTDLAAAVWQVPILGCACQR